MITKLKNLFSLAAAGKPAPVLVPVHGKCLIDVKITGVVHTFLQDEEFASQLIDAMKGGGFFSYATDRKFFLINLNLVERVDVQEKAVEIEDGDVNGCVVWNTGEKHTKLGVIENAVEQILNTIDKQFLKLGRHFFNRDEVALVVVKLVAT